MRSVDYRDMLSGGRGRKPVPEVPAENGLVVEDPAGGFVGAVVHLESSAVVLEDRHGRRRLFPLRPAAFLLDGAPVTLVRPKPSTGTTPRQSSSGSVRVEGLRARTAAAGRIWVEGVHDAELVERIWGHDLRVEGVVVEPLHGVDDLSARIAEFGPRRQARLGVLVDHLVVGSKEARIVAAVSEPDVLITGHPFVDVWQAVRPSVVGIDSWPVVPRGEDWKEGICRRVGWDDPASGWRHVLRSVRDFRDLETPLVGAVERLIDFVVAPAEE
jgi:hypothetical protein